MFSLSIIIPAYNEEANLENAVREVSCVAKKMNLDHEIIIVNDGSADRTGQVARRLISRGDNIRLVEHFPNRGYGGALKAGFAAAAKEWVAFFPADKQFEFSEIERLIQLADRADIVCGYRANRRDNFMRKLNALGWKTILRMLFGYLCRDIDCGFKLFRREILFHINLESNGAMVDTELLAGGRALGLRIAETPLTHLPRVAGAATGANPRVIVKAILDLAEFRLRLHRMMRENRPAHIETFTDRKPSPGSEALPRSA